MSRVESAHGRYAWVTVPASFYSELQGMPIDHDLDRFDFRVGGQIVDTTAEGGVLLDIDAYSDAAGNVTSPAIPPGITLIPGKTIRRVDVVAHLSDMDPHAPFYYRIGDEMVRLRDDGTSDPESRGRIVEGTCEYSLRSPETSYKEPTYRVERADGAVFDASEMELAKREPSFVNLREATRVIRDWIRPAQTKGRA